MARPEPEVAEELSNFEEFEALPKTLSLLSNTLEAGEHVVAAICGNFWFNSSALLVATPKRLIKLDRFLAFYVFRQHMVYELYWQDIESMVLEQFYLTITAKHTGDKSMSITLDGRQNVQAYFEVMHGYLSAAKTTGTVTASTSGAFIDQLERLAALRQSGAISDEEFEQAKRQLLTN